VTTVNHLEERDLGVTRQVHVLRAISYKLHQTTTCHFFLYPWLRKKIWRLRKFWKNVRLTGI
jgi:hypothetical protein